MQESIIKTFCYINISKRYLSPEFTWDLVEEIDIKCHTRQGITLVLMKTKGSSTQRGQATVLKRKTQLRLNLSHSGALDLRYGL